MLNPSTADSDFDDPTIRRCSRFGRDAGYAGIAVGNLFAWRATNPAELRAASDPIGPDNDSALAELIASAPVVVCAWGSWGSLFNRGKEVLWMIRNMGKVPHCLLMTSKGHPGHPLYAPATLRPTPIAQESGASYAP